jgi:hypothetical protein
VTAPVPRGWRDMSHAPINHPNRVTGGASHAGLSAASPFSAAPNAAPTPVQPRRGGAAGATSVVESRPTSLPGCTRHPPLPVWPLWRQRAVRRRSRNPQPSQDNSTDAAGNLDRCVGSGQQRFDGDARGKFPQDQAVRGHVENGEVGDDPVDQGPFVAPVRGASPRSRRRGRTLGRGDEEARTCRNRLRCRASSSAMG